jgi:TPP-dependent pyruvate/acetoin dehydrogenase alpha subunit
MTWSLPQVRMASEETDAASREAMQAPHVRSLYRKALLVRKVEERIAAIYPSDKIKSPVHLAIGQEAIAAAICDVLRPDDVVACTYRSHAAYLAKGGDLKAMFAEMYGKDTGCARGKGGSMHLVDMDRFVLGASAVVGTTIPVALGYALAVKREKRGRVVVAFFGDGATEEGVFYESLNFAVLHRLPVLFVCENNLYAIHTPLEKRWAVMDICRKVEGFGLSVSREEEMDALRLRRMADDIVARLRDGGLPHFLECKTYRWREHVGPAEDYEAGYRDRGALLAWQSRDPIPRLAAMLPPAERSAIDAEIDAAIEAAVAFAERSPVPEPQELMTHVFADPRS